MPKRTSEEQEEPKSGLAALRASVLTFISGPDLSKSAPPPPADDDEDEEEDEGGVTSQEDREKEAAPSDAPSEDDDEDEDEGDGQAPPQSGQAPPPQDGQAPPPQPGQAPPPQEAAPPPPAPIQKKVPPQMVRKSVDEASDAEVQAEVLRRAQAEPDFLKSLLALPGAEELTEAIDMSDVVAMIVQHAGERESALRVEIAGLQKSLTAATERQAEDTLNAEVILKGMGMILQGHAELTKSIGAIQEGVELVKSQDNGKVSHGVATLRTPERATPGAAPKRLAPAGDADPDGLPDKNAISRALMKSFKGDEPVLTQGDAMRFLGQLDGATGVAGVFKALPDEVKALI